MTALESAIERLELLSKDEPHETRGMQPIDQAEALVLLEHLRKREINVHRLNMEGPIATVQYEIHGAARLVVFDTLAQAQLEVREAKKRGASYRIVRVTTTRELL